jgi:hypothetical protein
MRRGDFIAGFGGGLLERWRGVRRNPGGQGLIRRCNISSRTGPKSQ